MKRKGLIVAIDGCDGSGKDTVIALVRDQLYKIYPTMDIRTTRSPGGTPWGEKLRAVAKDGDISRCALAERLLMASDNAQVVEEVVRPASERENCILLMSRISGITDFVYGLARGIGLNTIGSIQNLIPHIAPDIYVVVDVDDAVARQRRGGEAERGNDYFDKNQELMTRVCAAYHDISDENSASVLRSIVNQRCHEILVLDGNLEPRDVIKPLLKRIRELRPL